MRPADIIHKQPAPAPTIPRRFRVNIFLGLLAATALRKFRKQIVISALRDNWIPELGCFPTGAERTTPIARPPPASELAPGPWPACLRPWPSSISVSRSRASPPIGSSCSSVPSSSRPLSTRLVHGAPGDPSPPHASRRPRAARRRGIVLCIHVATTCAAAYRTNARMRRRSTGILRVIRRVAQPSCP